MMLVMVAACARPIGDLGRAKPSVDHDVVLPTLGWWRAKIMGEPASSFNWTDEENEMHDRVWRFLIAAHSKDWFYDIIIEWQRTRLIPPVDKSFGPGRYYDTLRWERYRSSRTRYVRVSRDIEADLATAPSVFEVICRVMEIDRRRYDAVSALRNSEAPESLQVGERHAENQIVIDWFVRAMRYRYESYSLALERLLIETPHEGARDIDSRLSVMAIDVERAERGEFCSSPDLYGGPLNDNTLPSRMKNQPFSPGPKYRK